MSESTRYLELFIVNVNSFGIQFVEQKSQKYFQVLLDENDKELVLTSGKKITIDQKGYIWLGGKPLHQVLMGTAGMGTQNEVDHRDGNKLNFKRKKS